MEMTEEKISLGDRIKKTEKKYQITIPKDEHIVIRLDGHGFSKYTKGFTKPFDILIVETMVKVSEELSKEYKACFVYTQSDEITLILPAKENKEHIFKGKTDKIVSLTSSSASVLFNTILKEEILKEIKKTPKTDKEKISHLKSLIKKKIGKAKFDSRAFGFKDETEVFNTILWRMRDAERNSITMLASKYYSTKELHKKNSGDKREMLMSIGVVWDKEDGSVKYGTYIKKEVYEKTTGSFRTRFKRCTDKLFYSEENVEMIFA